MSLESFKIPEKQVTLLDELVRGGFFKSRGEAIRYAISNFVIQWLEDEK